MWINHKKELVLSFLFFVLIFISVNLLSFLFSDSRFGKDISQVSAVAVFSKDNVQNIKLAFVGDIMLDRGVENSVYKNFNGNYAELFAKVKGVLKSYDVLFGNLEGPISDQGTDEGGVFSFRMEPKVIPVLKEVGFNVLSIANNHIFNWGDAAFKDTLRLLSDAGMTYIGGDLVGAKSYGGEIINIEGVRITLLAFSEFKVGGVTSSSTNPGISVISEKEIKDSVSQARSNSDLVVASFHFGEEYQDLPNSYQRKYAKLAVDSGADLIIGHHPHVLQTLEQYKNSYIIYSLGNFIFDQYFSPETMRGGLLEVEVNPGSKQIESAILKKVQINNLFQIESIE